MKIRAESSRQNGDPGKITQPAFCVLAALLVLPGYALSQWVGRIHWSILLGTPLAFSLITFFAYRSDKYRAKNSRWRIPEFTLHLVELAGGWPGAFLAQRKFRHKTSKLSYQVVFWLIVSLHQFAAVDSTLGWKFSRQAWQLLKPD